MANKTTVNIDIKVEDKDLATLENTLKDLNISFASADGAVGELGKSLDTVVGSLADVGMEAKVFNEIESGANDAVGGLKKFEKGAKDAAKETAKVGKEATIFDDIGDRFNDMTKGVRKVIVSMKTLKGAIAATGIGLLITGFASLVAYFKSSEEGSRKLAIATESLGLIFNNIVEFLGKIGEGMVAAFENPVESLKAFGKAIIDNILERFRSAVEVIGLAGRAIAAVFKGNFKEAGELAKEAGSELIDVFTGVDDTVGKVKETAVETFNSIKEVVAEATVTATKLVDATRAYRDLNQELIVQNAELNQDLEEQRKIAEDTTLTFEERKTALEEVGKIQVQLAENVAKQAQAEEDLLKTQIANEVNYEKREELETQLAEATAARIDAQTQLSIVELEAGKLGRELDLEELDRKRAINDIINQLGLESIENQFEQARQELDIQEQAALNELDLLKATEAQKQAVRDAYQGKREKLAEEESEYNKGLARAEQNAKLDIVKQGFMAISSLLGEQSAVGKAAAVAAATIDSYQAFNNALAETPLPPPFPQIAAGIALAAGLANVRKILQTKVPGAPGGGAGGGAIPSLGGGSPIGRIGDLGGSIDAGQLANATAPRTTTTQPAFQTYVLAGSVTSAQEADAKLSTRRNIG